MTDLHYIGMKDLMDFIEESKTLPTNGITCCEVSLEKAREIAETLKEHDGYSFLKGAEKVDWWQGDNVRLNVIFVEFLKDGRTAGLASMSKFGKKWYLNELGAAMSGVHLFRNGLNAFKNAYHVMNDIYMQPFDLRLRRYYLKHGVSKVPDSEREGAERTTEGTRCVLKY